MRILRVRWYILSVVALMGMSAPSAIAVTESGSVDVSGLVLGPPPATAPTITAPAQNNTFTEKNIEVKGSCIAGLIVKVFRNAVFAGSALCGPGNHYEMRIDLVEGRNDLIARQYDSANQASPDSDTVTVFYDPPAPSPPLPDQPGTAGPTAPSPTAPRTSAPPSQVADFELIIDYDYSFKGVGVNTPVNLPIHFIGGTPPYAVSVNWGDGNTTLVSRETAEQFFLEHIYKEAGIYTVRLRISDKEGREAYLQFVLIVNGKTPASDATLFGQPITASNIMPYIAVPAIAFGALGIAGGFFFADWWRGRKFPLRSSRDKKPPKQS